MSKQDLVNALVKKAVCTKKEAVNILNVVLGEITGALKKGQDVVLTGFGTFKVVKRKARTGRNPQTGESLQIPARKVVRFKVGADLKKTVK